MQIVQFPAFGRAVKKLHASAKHDLDEAVKELLKNPAARDSKKGDLAGISVYKFRIENQLALLAYTYEEPDDRLALLALSPPYALT
jgi:hypothetical protein